MGKQVFLLSGILFALWAGFGFGDETSATENLIQGATLPTRGHSSLQLRNKQKQEYYFQYC